MYNRSMLFGHIGEDGKNLDFCSFSNLLKIPTGTIVRNNHTIVLCQLPATRIVQLYEG